MTYTRLQRITAWVVSLGFVLLGLMYLNGAFFSAWVSGGPPNPYPLGWERRAIGQLGLSLASFILSLGSYKLILSLPSWRRVPVALIFSGLLMALTPFIGRFVLQDQCRGHGGQWSNLTLECAAK